MEQNIVIGIEGEVASGKTSICRELTNMIENCIFIDGGAIYRGIVLAIAQSRADLFENLDLGNNKNSNHIFNIDPLELMKKLHVEFKIEEKQTQIYIDGNKIDENEIQTMENAVGVTKMASEVNNDTLYKFARKIIDEYRKKFNIIVSARDLIAIYPEMTCYIYITASLEERVQRRYNQYNGKYTIEEIRNMIIARDKMHQDSGFNKDFENTIKIDVTNCKTKEESAKLVLKELTSNGFIN